MGTEIAGPIACLPESKGIVVIAREGKGPAHRDRDGRGFAGIESSSLCTERETPRAILWSARLQADGQFHLVAIERENGELAGVERQQLIEALNSRERPAGSA